MADATKKPRYYRVKEEVVCLRYNKKDGTPAKVTKGKTASGLSVTVVPAGDAHRIIFEEVREGSPWPGQRADGTWIEKPAI